MRLRSRGKVVWQGPCDADGCQSSDAKTLYDDGTGWCFSCRTYFPNEHKRSYRPKDNGESVNTQKLYPVRERMTSHYAQANNKWLSQYLSDEEIDAFFFYNFTADRHIFAYHEGEEDQYYEARTVKQGILPKVYSDGVKPSDYLIGPWKETGVIVVVEDIVSAIKVSRTWGALCLFGSHMTSAQAAWLASLVEVDHIVVWLDSDKYHAAMHFAKMVGMLKSASAVQTLLDPKAIADAGILNIIQNAIEQKEIVHGTSTKAC